MKLTNSVRVPSPDTYDAPSNITGVQDKFTFPIPSAWEPISLILHKITTQCACLLLQQLYTPYINALVSGNPHMLLYTHQPANSATLQHIPHIHNIQATDCLRLSTERCCHFVPCPDKVDHRTSHSEKNYHFKMMMSLPRSMSCTLYITHNLDRRVKCIWSLPHCI